MSKRLLIVHRKTEPLPQRLLDFAAGKELAVITETGNTQYYGEDVLVRQVPSAGDTEAVRQAALDIMAESTVDSVVAPFEMTVPAAAFLRSYFDIPGMKYDTAVGFANKYVMKTRMAAHDIPVAAHRVAYSLSQVAEQAALIGWPVVVKPALGWGSRDIGVLADESEFTAFQHSTAGAELARLDVPLIVEERIDIEREYHVDGVVRDGRVEFAAVSAYFTPMLNSLDRLGSYFFAAHDPQQPILRRLHDEAVTALGLRDGVTHMELFGTADGLKVGEIACRPGGGGIPKAIELQHGVDLWDAFLNVSVGRKPNLRPTERNGQIAHYYLPLRAGRVSGITDAAELASIPSVLDVDIKTKPGDVIERVTPTTTAGEVYLRVADLDDIVAATKQIAEVYTLEIDGRAHKFAPGFTG